MDKKERVDFLTHLIEITKDKKAINKLIDEVNKIRAEIANCADGAGI